MAGKLGEELESYMLEVISDRKKGKWPTTLRIMLKQLSLLFRSLVQLRLKLYKNGIMRPHTLGCQVISVGNLTVGGTGKTPVVEVFARSLTESGRKVAILSRGYKREKPPFSERMKNKFKGVKEQPKLVSDGDRLLLDSAQSGDEPFMLASNLPNVSVIVCKDRVGAGRYATKKLGCDTLILDDGFQYLRLRHRLDIVLVDRTNPFGNRNVLPRGVLREPIKNIKRAGFIFITKSNGDGAKELRDELRKLNPTAEISECRHSAKYVRDIYSKEEKPLEILKGLKVVAVSGIAVPQGFEDELVRLGATVVKHFTYTDHHRYTQQEIIDIVNESIELKVDAILTTEKDAVRFPRLERRDIPIYFLRVEIELFSGSEEFNDWINRICFN